MLAVAWGIFGVRGDTRGGGRAPVYVPGCVRLILELTILLGGGLALVAAGQIVPGIVFMALVLFHNLASFGRIRWLLRH
jgi:hypothetical protein